MPVSLAATFSVGSQKEENMIHTSSEELLKRRNRETAMGIGLGLLIEGFIILAMIYICGFREAVSFCLMMIVISAFLGCCLFAFAKNHKNGEHVRG